MYQYTPLIDPASDIRLVRLLPKKGQDVTCKIIHEPLVHAPAYEAVSYTWGTNVQDHELQCLDEYNEGEIRNLAITANLMAALRRLQLDEEPRNLWIDQISIDQSDDREKVHQICMMGHIYERCSRVVIWLGEETDQLKRAVQLHYEAFNEPFSETPVNSHGGNATQDIRQTTLSVEDSFRSDWWNDLSDQDIHAFNSYYSLPWFNRLWVVQEAALSPEAIFVCGSYVLPWRRVERFSDGALRSKLLSNSNVITMRLQRERSNEGHRVGFRPLFVLETTRQFQCSDDRDRFLALLGLFETEVMRMVDIYLHFWDGFQAYRDFFIRGALAFLGGDALRPPDNPLGILSSAGTRNKRPPNADDLEASWPSWVPDWNHEITISRPQIPYGFSETDFAATAGSTFQMGWQPENPDEIKLDGKRISRVQLIFAPYVAQNVDGRRPRINRHHEGQKVLLEWHCALQVLASRFEDIEMEEFEEAFAKMLIIDCGMITSFETQTFKDQRNVPLGVFITSLKIIWEIASSDMSEPAMLQALLDSPLFISYYQLLNKACHGQRFFILDDGSFGLCPPETQQGDFVFLLFGGKVPFVLRRNPRSKNSAERDGICEYNLVGDCYVDGIMHGEAMKRLDLEDELVNIW